MTDPRAWQGPGQAALPPDVGANSVISLVIHCDSLAVTERDDQTMTNWLQCTHIADSVRAHYDDRRLVTPTRSTNSARRLHLVCRDGLDYW